MARVTPLRILEDLLSSGDVFICLPLYRFLPSFFLLSLLLLSCLTYSNVVVSKGRLFGPAMRGLCAAAKINAPPRMLRLIHVHPVACRHVQGATEHVRGSGDISICLSICQVSVFTDLIQVQG